MKRKLEEESNSENKKIVTDESPNPKIKASNAEENKKGDTGRKKDKTRRSRSYLMNEETGYTYCPPMVEVPFEKPNHFKKEEIQSLPTVPRRDDLTKRLIFNSKSLMSPTLNDLQKIGEDRKHVKGKRKEQRTPSIPDTSSFVPSLPLEERNVKTLLGEDASNIKTDFEKEPKITILKTILKENKKGDDASIPIEIDDEKIIKIPEKIQIEDEKSFKTPQSSISTPFKLTNNQSAPKTQEDPKNEDQFTPDRSTNIKEIVNHPSLPVVIPYQGENAIQGKFELEDVSTLIEKEITMNEKIKTKEETSLKPSIISTPGVEKQKDNEPVVKRDDNEIPLPIKELLLSKGYKVKKRLNSQGTVFKIKSSNGEKYAAKIVICQNLRDEILIHQEILILNMIKSKFTSSIKENFCLKNVNIIIFNLEVMTLEKKIKKYKDSVDDNLLKVYLREIAESLEFINSKKIIHNNVHQKHILISHEGKCKIADFRLSKCMNVGSLDVNTDIFFFGLLAFYMKTGYDMNLKEGDDVNTFNMPKEIAGSLKSLILRCCSKNKDDRPFAKDIVTELRDPNFKL